MKNALLRAFGTTAAFALVGMTAAQAAPVIVQSQSQTYQAGPTLEPTPWSTLFTFDKYTGPDPLLGVQLILSGTAETTLTLTNNVGSSTTVSGSVGAQLDALVQGTTISLQTIPSIPFSETVAGNDTVVLGPSTGTNSTLQTLTSLDGANFTFFIGAGTFDVDLDADGLLQLLGGGGNITAQQVTSAFGTFTVNYIADVDVEIAEPGILAAFGLGLIGLGVMRRQRRDA